MAKQIAFDLNEDIVEKPIEQVMPSSMMIYSEHVILDRALPRVEDGLKPVQRRVLYTMYNLKMMPNTAYKKSARIVGDCMGKYHPHGDSSIYGAMVNMAQDFSMRMPLVDGHGNFGTIDDGPAAMRYTEARLAPIATELLRDLDKRTVKMVKNFDDTLDEPEILPSRYPNLLVNGTYGIAIGLATNIPSHNLTEVIDGCVALIEQPNMKLPELVKIIKGPDFPSGGFLVGGEDILKVYETGRGKLILRGKVDIENTDGDRQNIVITEAPFNVNPTVGIVNRLYKLRETKKEIFGNIIDAADESDKNGMRIVIKLKKGEDAVKLLDQIYKHTDLQANFNVNMVAIAGGKPRQLGLIQLLKYYLEHQRNVIYKRSQFEIEAAKNREEILTGYSIIMPAIDEVIAIIRGAVTRAEAKVKLRERFGLTENQAEAILQLQLGNINKMDVNKYLDELKELRKNIERLAKILGSVKEQYAVVREELLEIRDRYKTKRLTTIIDSLEDVDVKPFDPTKRTSKRCVVAIDRLGCVKVLSSRNYISANREAESSGQNGLTVSMAQVEPEYTTLVFGSLGNCYKLDQDKIMERTWLEPGEKLVELYPTFAPKDEAAVTVMSFNSDEVGEKEVYIYTKLGMVKKTALKNYVVNKDAYQVISLKEEDEVIGVEIVEENATIMFVTSDGQCVISEVDDYPQHGRIAGGVIGVNLNQDAVVVYAGQATVEPGTTDEGEEAYMPLGEIVVITDKGTGKKVVAAEFSPMRRNRKGLRIIDIYGEPIKVIFAAKVLEPYDIAIEDESGAVQVFNTENIRIENKNTKGKPIVRGVKIKRIVRHIEEI